MSFNNKNFHDTSIERIVLATHAADQGNEEDTKNHISEAEFYADHHAKLLKLQGKHKDAQDYSQHFNEHVERIKGLLNKRMQKAEKCMKDHSKMEKDQTCGCGYMTKSLEKAGELHDKTPWSASAPKKDARYHYKKLNDLHPEDQEKAQQSYSHVKDLGRYVFPTHKDTGRLAHANLAPFEGHSATQASHSSYKELKPEHQKGASVRINAPGHKYHGKLGIMHGRHPEIPNKVGVQVGPSQAHIMYVEPHHVQLSKPANKIEKALITLHNIRKAFMK